MKKASVPILPADVLADLGYDTGAFAWHIQPIINVKWEMRTLKSCSRIK